MKPTQGRKLSMAFFGSLIYISGPLPENSDHSNKISLNNFWFMLKGGFLLARVILDPVSFDRKIRFVSADS